MIKYIIVCMLFVTGCGISQESADAVRYVCTESCEKAEIDVLVLSFGQSNSLGVAGDKALFNEKSNVFFFDGDGWGNSHDYGRTGPEASLGESLGVEYPDKNIGIIKIAVGGTRIEEWFPSTEINDGLIETIESAKIHGNIDHVTGYFWMQGESDSIEYMDSVNYDKNLNYLISVLRNDDAPFIIGLIGTKAFPYVDNVRSAQNYVASNTSEAYVVETNDLPLHADGVHFNENSLKILGDRFAEKFIEVSE